jgi:hypothetical protein
MAEATVTTRLEVNNPCMEVVVLTASDGETYISKKFGTVTGAVASGNEDQDAHINAPFSGQTVTLNYAGMTDKLVTLILFGRK